MWAIISLVGFIGMVTFGILAVVTALRKKNANSYLKYAIVCFVLLIASLVFYKA